MRISTFFASAINKELYILILMTTHTLQSFSAYLHGIDGGGKRIDDAEKQMAIVERIVAHLDTFNLDIYQAKHIKVSICVNLVLYVVCCVYYIQHL